MWRDTGRCRGVGVCRDVQGGVGKCGEVQAGVGRYGEVWGV